MLIKTSIYYLILSSCTILIIAYSNEFIPEQVIFDSVITNCTRPTEGERKQFNERVPNTE